MIRIIPCSVAAETGTPMICSTLSTVQLEQMAKEAPAEGCTLWFQVGNGESIQFPQDTRPISKIRSRSSLILVLQTSSPPPPPNLSCTSTRIVLLPKRSFVVRSVPASPPWCSPLMRRFSEGDALTSGMPSSYLRICGESPPPFHSFCLALPFVFLTPELPISFPPTSTRPPSRVTWAPPASLAT